MGATGMAIARVELLGTLLLVLAGCAQQESAAPAATHPVTGDTAQATSPLSQTGPAAPLPAVSASAPAPRTDGPVDPGDVGGIRSKPGANPLAPAAGNPQASPQLPVGLQGQR